MAKKRSDKRSEGYKTRGNEGGKNIRYEERLGDMGWRKGRKEGYKTKGNEGGKDIKYEERFKRYGMLEKKEIR